MPTLMPSSELLRRAVVFIDETRREHPEKKFADILDEAAMRFNLSPLDCEALARILDGEKPKNSQS